MILTSDPLTSKLRRIFAVNIISTRLVSKPGANGLLSFVPGDACIKTRQHISCSRVPQSKGLSDGARDRHVGNLHHVSRRVQSVATGRIR